MRHVIAKIDSLPDLKGYVYDFNMAYYCKHCGAELMCILEYKNPGYTTFIREQTTLRNITSDPEKVKNLNAKIKEAERKQQK